MHSSSETQHKNASNELFLLIVALTQTLSDVRGGEEGKERSPSSASGEAVEADDDGSDDLMLLPAEHFEGVSASGRAPVPLFQGEGLFN